jgi:hypothetical protein
MANWQGINKAVDSLAKGNLFKETEILGANKSINSAADCVAGAGELMTRIFKGEGPKKAFDSTFREEVKEGETEGAMKWGKVAGAYIGASAGVRVLSGGGITRDRNGNPNLIGVPFV